MQYLLFSILVKQFKYFSMNSKNKIIEKLLPFKKKKIKNMIIIYF